MTFDEALLNFQGKVATGLGPGESVDFSTQTIYSKPEHTVISETEETVFVQDETGAPHVFTREEWQKMQGTGGAGLVVLGVLAAGLLLLA